MVMGLEMSLCSCDTVVDVYEEVGGMGSECEVIVGSGTCVSVVVELGKCVRVEEQFGKCVRVVERLVDVHEVVVGVGRLR